MNSSNISNMIPHGLGGMMMGVGGGDATSNMMMGGGGVSLFLENFRLWCVAVSLFLSNLFGLILNP